MDFKDVKEVRVTLTLNDNDGTLVTFDAFEMAKEVLANYENADEMKSRIFNELVEQLQEALQVDVFEAIPENPNNIIGVCKLIRCDTVKEIKIRFIGYGEENKNDN